MNKGNQKKTTEKYLNYLCDLIINHHLTRFKKINLKDNELLKKYFPDRVNTLNQAYSYMIKQLINLGIVIDTDGSFIPKVKSKYYTLDMQELFKLLQEYGMMDNLTESEFIKEYYFSNIVDDSYPHSLINNVITSSYNDNKVEEEYKKYFDKVDKICSDLKPLKYKKDKIPDNVSKDLINYYEIKVKYYNPIYVECLKLIDWINNNQSICQYRMPLHCDVSGKSFNIYTFTARQYTSYALMGKDYRMGHLSRYDLDSEFDLHSAIFAIARLLNSGEFNCDWDIKRIIEPEYDNWDDQSKKEYKLLLNRMFFTHSVSQAWTQYTHPYKKGNCSAEDFYDYYDMVQHLTYGTLPYIYNIFFYESLFELLVVKELIEKGYDVANVYDCFYYNSNQISELEIKNIIEQIAYNFNDYISLISH